MLVPLLCAALAAAPPARPLPKGLLAVLELKNKLKGADADADTGYLTDEIRSLALKQVPGLRVITRENMLVLLQSSGRKLEDCEGECEVETGRRIGADLVVSGELLKFGSSYKLDLKLHDTGEGRLLAGAIASGKTIDELDAAIGAAVTELFTPLRAAAAQQQGAPLQVAQPPGAQQGAAQQGAAQQGAQQQAAQQESRQQGAQQQVKPRQVAPPPGAQQGGQQGGPPQRPQAPPLVHGLVTRLEPKTNLPFVRVMAGSAQLGCAAGDDRCAPDERPAREVGVGGFWIGRTEVTTGAFAACAKAHACNAAADRRDVPATGVCNWHNRRWNHPMNCVTWEEAAAFCRWIGGRLPTAVEWEYAARAGTGSIFPWGNDRVTGARANFCDVNCPRSLKDTAQARKRADLTQDDGWAGTAPVGSYPAGANQWGLLDMAGNVAEWTATSWGGDDKEVRGGTWSMPAFNLRTSHRHHVPLKHDDGSVGFRCVQ